MKTLKFTQNINRQQLYSLQPYGTNLIYYKKPSMVAWWSAAFPGFGHILLGQYLKGLVLFLWEMAVNQGSGLNAGLVATLEGDFLKAKVILDPVWILLYAPVYIFTIWDSYQCTIENNNAINTTIKGFRPFEPLIMGGIGSNIFSPRKPGMALFWSLFSPGAGQFYLHRLIEAFFFMIWFVVICYYSHFFEGLLYLFEGKLLQSNQVYNAQWFMYLPSIFFFSAFNAYSDAFESNIFYRFNQIEKYKKKHQHTSFHVEFPGN